MHSQRFVEAGGRVAIADLNLDAGSAAAELGGEKDAIAVAADVSDGNRSTRGRCDAKAFGAVDILVSNAGIQIVQSDRGISLRPMEEAAGHPSRRRLSDTRRV